MKENKSKEQKNSVKNTPKKSSIIFKKVFPHICAIIIMYLLTIIYFSPVFFDNKDLPQGDMVSVQGMTQEVKTYQEKTGEYSEWTNSMFSGMPTTTLWAKPVFNVFTHFASYLREGMPLLHAGLFFSYLIGFYIFMLCMGANAWMSLLGAIMYAFASYNLIIIEAGHVTKGYAMAFIAPMLGGIILAFRKRYIIGSIVTLIFLGIEISCNHIQITYYALIMVLAIAIAYFIYYIQKEKTLKPFFKAVGVLIIAAILAVLPNIGSLLPTYAYSKDTMRGGSELTIVPENQDKANTKTPNEGGLEKDYAFAWSYGKMETFTLLVPDLYGGGQTILKPESKTMEELRQNGYGSSYLPTYWGEQPFTSGPVYAGAVVCFLFILSLFVIKGPEKWWVIGVCVLSLILAWGKNFDVINNFLFHYLPFYNKFRTPAMALIIAGVAMPILSILGLNEILSGKIDKDLLLKKIKISYFITAGLCIFLLLAVAMFFSFTGIGDEQFKQQLLNAGFKETNAGTILSILTDHRKSMAYSDIFRSIGFITLSFGVIWFFAKGKLKNMKFVIVSLLLLVLVDGWSVAKRYLNNDNFQTKNKINEVHQPNIADQQILQDKDINYRVLNLASNTFNESNTSYFHKSIGGYSPAKLRRYQDVIDFHITKEIQAFYSEIMKTQGNMTLVNPNSFRVLNMLNTKYVIVPTGNNQIVPLQNPYAYGNAWFVNAYKLVQNPDEEILAIDKLNVKDTAIIDKQYADMVKGKDISRDTTAKITNTLCNPDHLTYTYSSSKEQLATFSEIFYNKGGWVSFIDGKEVPHFRVNYILRAMIVPAGQHTIEFRYVPHLSILSAKISMISSFAVILLILGSIVYGIMYHRKDKFISNDKNN